MLNATIPQVTCELLALLNILQFRKILFFTLTLPGLLQNVFYMFRLT